MPSPTSPSHRFAMGAFLSPLKGGEGFLTGPARCVHALALLRGRRFRWGCETVPMRAWRDLRLLLVIFIVAAALTPAASRADEQVVQIGWLSQAVKRSLPLSYLDQPPRD